MPFHGTGYQIRRFLQDLILTDSCNKTAQGWWWVIHTYQSDRCFLQFGVEKKTRRLEQLHPGPGSRCPSSWVALDNMRTPMQLPGDSAARTHEGASSPLLVLLLLFLPLPDYSSSTSFQHLDPGPLLGHKKNPPYYDRRYIWILCLCKHQICNRGHTHCRADGRRAKKRVYYEEGSRKKICFLGLLANFATEIWAKTWNLDRAARQTWGVGIDDASDPARSCAPATEVPRNAPFSTKLLAIAAALCFPQIHTCTKYIHVRVLYYYYIILHIVKEDRSFPWTSPVIQPEGHFIHPVIRLFKNRRMPIRVSLPAARSPHVSAWIRRRW